MSDQPDAALTTTNPKEFVTFVSKVVIAILMKPTIAHYLASAGFNLTPEIANIAIPAVVGYGLHVFHDWFKRETGWALL